MDRKDIRLGGEPLDVETKPRSGTVISARLTAEESDELFALARQQGKRVAQVAREALLSYLRAGGAQPPVRSAWTGTVNPPGAGNLELRFSDHRGMAHTSASGPAEDTPALAERHS